ncbi:MAG TPA: hypothetical protein VMT11_11855 [Myxococcaceae bacterium]|nr:hypothetical protein [Myxococcaceae bacterium]
MRRSRITVLAVPLGLSALGGCAHEVYQPAPARVEAPVGSLTFDDCELGDGSSVPAAFPRGSLAPPGAPEHALACGLSAELAALGEPSLFPLPRTAEVYRVLWIRAGAHPVSVRFERQGNSGQLRGAQTSGKGLAAPGDVLEESTTVATTDQVRDLLGRIEAARFWAPAAPPTAPSTVDSGSLWVFEGVRAGDYRVRVFQRDTLARDPAFSALGRGLVGVSGLHLEGAVY